ncbi:MAG: substrate-binding domain-containing protein, partial [Dethiobacteria bacterium]
MGKDLSHEFKIILQLEGKRSLSGNDLFNLLENIMVSGSISGAAARMGASYRYCWGLLREAEKTLGLALVDKQVGGVAGGGTTLTFQGKELLAQYKAFKQKADSQLKHFQARAGKNAEVTGTQPPTRHLLLASTMEAVETGLMDLLEEAFLHTSGILVRHISAGSGRALQIAREGRVDMVLTHAPELEKAFMDEGWGIEMFPIM